MKNTLKVLILVMIAIAFFSCDISGSPSNNPADYDKKHAYTLDGDRMNCNLMGRIEPHDEFWVWQTQGRGDFPIGTWISVYDYEGRGSGHDTYIFKSDRRYTMIRFNGDT